MALQHLGGVRAITSTVISSPYSLSRHVADPVYYEDHEPLAHLGGFSFRNSRANRGERGGRGLVILFISYMALDRTKEIDDRPFLSSHMSYEF